MSHYPPPLQKGDTIGVMSTSCWVPEEDVFKAKKFIEDAGYNVFIHPQTLSRLNQSAGNAQEKIDAFNELIANPDIKAIFGARGGNRAGTMLSGIDFDLIKKNPKIITGYSDLTVLTNPIHHKTGLVTYQGPLFRELPTHPDYNQMIQMLSGENPDVDLSGCKILKNGNAEGKILGGNLSAFQSLIGTPYMPDLNGAILILEDVSDHISRYDRMLCQLKNTGLLSQLSGLIIGAFTNMKDSKDNPFGFTLEDVLLEHTEGLDIPILMDAPFGHADRLVTMPIGAPATLKNGTLSFKSLP